MLKLEDLSKLGTIKPVNRENKSDKWCKFMKGSNKCKDIDAPYGCIISIPNEPWVSGIVLNLNGYVIRWRLYKNMIQLQLVTTPQYEKDGRRYKIDKVYTKDGVYLNVKKLRGVD